MPGKPQFYQFLQVKMVPKIGKSTLWRKSIQFWNCQDTSCQISGHFSHAFSRKFHKIQISTNFTKSKWWKSTTVTKMPNFRPFLPCIIRKMPGNIQKWRQNKENQQIVTTIRTVLKIVMIHQHAKFQATIFMHSQGKALTPQILPKWGNE